LIAQYSEDDRYNCNLLNLWKETRFFSQIWSRCYPLLSC